MIYRELVVDAYSIYQKNKQNNFNLKGILI